MSATTTASFGQREGHLDPFGVDEVSVLETPCAKTDRLFTAFGGTRVYGNRHAELVSRRCQHLHLVIEPREPVYTVNGKKTDAPFHDEMLASREGEAAADELAIRTAMKVLGWSREKAEAFILGGKPDVK